MLKYYSTDKNLSFYERVNYEKELYREMKAKSKPEKVKVNVNEICNRGEIIYCEKEYHQPQNIFFISNKMNDIVLVGRKCWSILNQRNLINAPNCSLINYTMLFGILKRGYIEEREVKIFYSPFDINEKYTIFGMIREQINEMEIIYPYVYRDFYSGKEKICCKGGWTFNPERKMNLSNGEHHFREYTIRVFKQLKIEHAILYDPACSTGEFLYTIKKVFPSCYTIGHDISQQMITYARDFIDESLCVDAKDTPIEDASVDVMFLRFLNSELLSREDAIKYFDILIKKVKVGGYCICFGHTPFLICGKTLKNYGVEILSSIGFTEEYDSIFQYYILKRKSE